MPYKSKAQQRFMHAQHPEMAAEWDAATKKTKGGFKKLPERVKVEKARTWALKEIGGGIAAGAIGSAIANQIPQNQQPSKIGRLVNRKEKQVKAKVKGQVKKVAYEDVVKSADPEFNHDAARKIYDLVMKMDDDTAAVFCEMVVGEIYETTIEKNLRTLQRHLDEVLEHRLETIKKAMLRTVAKGHHAGAVEAAQMIDQLEEITKAARWVNPYVSGAYQFEESDFRRDPRTGQFMVKVKHNQTKPFSNRVAMGMGLAPTEPAQQRRYAKLNDRQRAQYQDEYQQLSQFLDLVTSSTAEGGDRQVFLRLRDKRGNEFRQPHAGGPDYANDALLNPNLTLVGIEASPTVLTAGGAAFGLTHALGAEPSPATAGRIGMGNRAIEGLPSFSESWTAQPEDMKSTNAQLYNRVGAAGGYLGTVAPPGSKAQMAAKMAEIVGAHGAEAEAVIGPAARKTAYRYRGTEKTPDRALVREYKAAVDRSKMVGPPEEEEEWVAPRPGGKPGVETRRRQPTKVRPGGGEPTPMSLAQQAAARQKAAHRAPTWGERAAGREIIRTYLKTKLPKGDLYSLQLASGVTPPSQGIMLNDKGQITAEAVGYGDDHYLPFNLKNLNSLKGGEYLRTRSVGGLTAEDIYTGLSAGARRVTVISRSGTFSVEFEPDFRGGRRHSDKARRMTRRYEQLLDAVQSNQVTRQPVPPPVEQAIRNEVAAEMRGESRAAVREAVKRRIEEYRQDPDMGPEDDKLVNLIYEQGLKDQPSRDSQEWLKTARNMVRQGKAFNYKLDAQGYEAAQNALEEQFPYYIRSQPVIEKEGERISFEPDLGYVEPGRGRPTAAKAGLYGTKFNQPGGAAVGSQKFSASQANYQRGRIGRGPGDITPGQLRPVQTLTREGEEGKEETKPGVGGQRKLSPAEKAIQRDQLNESALELFTDLKSSNVLADSVLQNNPVLDQSVESFAAKLEDPEVMEQFRGAVTAEFDHRQSQLPKSSQDAYRAFKRAVGDLQAREFSPGLAAHWTPEPMGNWAGKAYEKGAPQEEKDFEIRRINERTPSVTTGRDLSTLSDQELRNELNALRYVRSALRSDPSLARTENIEERKRVATRIFGSEYDARAIQMLTGNSERLDKSMEDIHRMRYLQQGVPDQLRAQTGSMTREGTSPPPSERILTQVGSTRAVEQRRNELQRYRAGMSILEEHPNPEVDAALADADHLIELINQGKGSDADIDSFLEETDQLAKDAPKDFTHLDRQEWHLYEKSPELFETDASGIVRRKRSR